MVNIIVCGNTIYIDAALAQRARFGGLTVPDSDRLQDLEAESVQLKKLLAESLLDAEALKVALGRKP